MYLHFILFAPYLSKIYATPNNHIPLEQIFLNLLKGMCYDYCLSRPSIKVLIASLRRKKTHSWVQYIEVPLAVNWLTQGLSYNVVSRVLDVPKTTVFDIVHPILSHLDKVVLIPPTLAQCT